MALFVKVVSEMHGLGGNLISSLPTVPMCVYHTIMNVIISAKTT